MGTIRGLVMLFAAGVALAAAAQAQARGQQLVTQDNIAISLTAEGKPYTLEQALQRVRRRAPATAFGQTQERGCGRSGACGRSAARSFPARCLAHNRLRE
jgi:hypothetical protein